MIFSLPKIPSPISMLPRTHTSRGAATAFVVFSPREEVNGEDLVHEALYHLWRPYPRATATVTGRLVLQHPLAEANTGIPHHLPVIIIIHHV